jgi:hypothetical protein
MEEGQSSVEAGLELDSLSLTPVARKGEKGLFPLPLRFLFPFSVVFVYHFIIVIISPLFLRARVY